MFNFGGPKDEFKEEELQKDEVSEENDDIDDVTATSIIELFAEEKDGFYYGKPEKIGSREECIKWIKGILSRDLDI